MTIASGDGFGAGAYFDDDRSTLPRRIARACGRPGHLLQGWVRQRLLLRSNKVFHLVLLQCADDPEMLWHSGFRSRAELIEAVIDAFVEGAAPGDHLAFLAHPLDDGREPLDSLVRELARDLGVGQRVIFLNGGGDLGTLLDRARAVITVNAAEARQALSRGVPVAALGSAGYRRPGLASELPLAAFIRQPERPDRRAWADFQRSLDETGRVAGSSRSLRNMTACGGGDDAVLTPRAV